MKKLVGLILLLIVIGVAGIGWVGTQTATRIWALDGDTGAIRWSVALPTGEQEYGVMPPVTTATLVIGWVLYRENTTETISLVARDRLSGSERWRWTLPAEQYLDYEERLLATPNRVYFPMVDGEEQRTLIALDAATGVQQWQMPAVVTFATLPPSASENADDIVVLSGTQGNFVLAYRSADGTVRWQVTQHLDEHHLWLRPILVATTEATYLLQQAGTVTAAGNWEANGTYDAQGYALANGAETIHYQQTGQEPIFYLGPTIVRASGYTVLGLNEATGELRWRYAVTDPDVPDKVRYLQTLSATTNLIYLVIGPNNFDELGWLIALNPSDGREQWRSQVVNQGFSSLSPPVATATTIGVPGDDGFVAVDRQRGSTRWTFAVDSFALTAGADENTFYFAERGPRWRAWLTLLAPSWRARAYGRA